MSDADLVVGVDVGSQGTCAQAIAADGTHVAVCDLDSARRRSTSISANAGVPTVISPDLT